MKDNIKLPPLHYDELPESDDAIPAMHNYARKAVKADRQLRGEPVAWHTEDHLTDKSTTTYDPVVAERWIEKGWSVSPLYYSPHPSAQDANALLIAAAPDLLEALDELANGYAGNGWDVGLATRLEKARAAIAKALGEAK